MFGFLIKRSISAIVLIFFVSFVTFGVMKIDFTVPEFSLHLTVPFTNVTLLDFYNPSTQIRAGDPLADLKLNPAISQARIDAEAKRLGLNQSFFKQYLTWLSNVMRGDLGLSQSNQRVIDLIKPALLNTLLLNIVALFTTWGLAIPLGIIAAVNKNKFADSFLLFLGSCFMSVPGFVLAIFLLLLTLQTGLFPIGGLTSSYFDELGFFAKILDISRHLALPVIILTLCGFVAIQRQMRGNLLDVLQEDYIRTARTKGLSENKVVYKHALINAINPLVTILGYEFSNLFAGSALIEMVLAYPGLGYLTLEAARKLDINLVLANLLIGSVMLVLGNLLADLLLLKLDPKVR